MDCHIIGLYLVNLFYDILKFNGYRIRKKSLEVLVPGHESLKETPSASTNPLHAFVFYTAALNSRGRCNHDPINQPSGKAISVVEAWAFGRIQI